MSLIKKSLLVAVLALFVHSTFAHTYLSTVTLDGTQLDQGDCVRPHPSTAFDSPIPLVTQADMTCGWLPQAASAANRKCPIAAGSKIGIQWHHNSNAATDDIIDPSHKGPLMFYMAKSDDGSGSVWFKIYEDGYSNGQWAVDRLLASGGYIEVTIPADIAPGNYLLRGEIIALHGAYDVNGAQPYVGCVELTVSGSGSARPATVSLPGAYSPTDPGILINIYSSFTTYTIPGPAVYKAGSSSSSSSGSSSTPSPTTTPTSTPTTVPTSAPTTKPTSTPTTVPTASPTTKPTTGSSGGSGGNVQVQMNSGSNVWWFAVAVSGGSESTVKVELADSGSVRSFTMLTPASYGYFFSQSVQLTLPISLRLTSASGKQIIVSNAFSSWSDTSVVDTNQNYGSSSGTSAPTTAPTSAPTTAPTTAPTEKPTQAPTTAPTDAPTSAPTRPPSGATVKLSQHASTSVWWLAVSVSGVAADDVATVELKDSGSYTEFSCLTSTSWGYYVFETSGTPLVAPVTIRVTSNSGTFATGTLSTIGSSSVVDTNASL